MDPDAKARTPLARKVPSPMARDLRSRNATDQDT
jgi:hypothetical protein